MSASEKLRALDGALRPEPGYRMTIGRREELLGPYIDALPLIADCIALAEQCAATGFAHYGYKAQLQESLTALREHLEGGDVT